MCVYIYIYTRRKEGAKAPSLLESRIPESRVDASRVLKPPPCSNPESQNFA